jgi:hypothetical protein
MTGGASPPTTNATGASVYLARAATRPGLGAELEPIHLVKPLRNADHELYFSWRRAVLTSKRSLQCSKARFRDWIRACEFQAPIYLKGRRGILAARYAAQQ